MCVVTFDEGSIAKGMPKFWTLFGAKVGIFGVKLGSLVAKQHRELCNLYKCIAL